MKVLIIYSHPNPNSFNSAIKQNLQDEIISQGHEAKIRDLYALNFNPILSAEDFTQLNQGNIPQDIKTEQDFISWCDTIVFVYPTWWSNVPAILRGYIDRVFSKGFAYTYNEQGPVALLKDKKIMIFQTTGSTEGMLMQNNMVESMTNSIDSGIFAFCGMGVLKHKYFFAVPTVSDEERKKMLEEVKEIVKNYMPSMTKV